MWSVGRKVQGRVEKFGAEYLLVDWGCSPGELPADVPRATAEGGCGCPLNLGSLLICCIAATSASGQAETLRAQGRHIAEFILH
jgi:hypothetical protein